MRWAYVGHADDRNARAIIGQLIENNDVNALMLNDQVIEVEAMVPLSDPHRRGLLYLCIECGGAVQRTCPRGWWRVRHSHPHNCNFLGDGF